VSNVLSKDKREQVIALGRLGWSLRRIEAAVHIRRETIGGYLRAAGIPVRPPGGWGRRSPAKQAIYESASIINENISSASASSEHSNSDAIGRLPTSSAGLLVLTFSSC